MKRTTHPPVYHPPGTVRVVTPAEAAAAAAAGATTAAPSATTPNTVPGGTARTVAPRGTRGGRRPAGVRRVALALGVVIAAAWAAHWAVAQPAVRHRVASGAGAPLALGAGALAVMLLARLAVGAWAPPPHSPIPPRGRRAR